MTRNEKLLIFAIAALCSTLTVVIDSRMPRAVPLWREFLIAGASLFAVAGWTMIIRERAERRKH